MDPDLARRVAARLEKAERKLEAAALLRRAGAIEDAVSRAYYSAFHAAQALLLAEGVEARSHEGIISMLGFHFVKTGRLERHLARALLRMREDRESGDYAEVTFFDPGDAAQAVKDAEAFIGRAREILGDLGWTPPA